MKKNPFEHIVIPKYTNFSILNNEDVTIQQVYQLLAQDIERNEMIINDLIKSIKEGRSPLLLTERIEQLEYFKNKLNGLVKNIFIYKGGMGRKQLKKLDEKLLSLSENEERVIISTGRYIGEGFNNQRLDTLFLAMPISWRGTLSQYAGRLHRLDNNKTKVIVFDYVDFNIAKLKNMYNKRVKGYKVIGYRICEQNEFLNNNTNYHTKKSGGISGE